MLLLCSKRNPDAYKLHLKNSRIVYMSVIFCLDTGIVQMLYNDVTKKNIVSTRSQFDLTYLGVMLLSNSSQYISKWALSH